MGTKRRDAVDPPRPLRDKESNRQGTDPTQSGTRTLTMLRTKQHLFVGLLGLFLGLLLLSAQVRAGVDDEKFCCRANNAKCNSCKEGISMEEYCKKSLPSVPPGCKREGCCKAFTAKCRACHRGVSKKEFCKQRPKVPGCESNFRDCKKDPSASGCKWVSCCKTFTSNCVACSKGISEVEFCKKRPNFKGCEKLG